MFTVQEILNAAQGELIRGDRERVIGGVSIDSRTITRGELFIAVKGARFDGHDFIPEALAKGAAAIITNREPRTTDHEPRIYIRVSDTVKALGDIACYYRQRFAIPLIAVTGSSGKTTTKEMIAFLLAHKFRVLKNEGTENNFFGVPLTLLRLGPEHDMAVIELGTSGKGEIKRLAEITAPTMGVITNIGIAHLAGLKSLEAIVKEKSALFTYLDGKGTKILNADDPNLRPTSEVGPNEPTSKVGLKMSTKNEPTSKVGQGVIAFGIDNPADFMAAKIEYGKQGVCFLLNNTHKIELPLLGRHNVYNALAAIAVSRQFSLDYAAMQSRLKRFKAPAMRMELERAGDIDIINDTYNSNPFSMGCAVCTLAEYKTRGRRIIVSGDMLELGKEAEKFHRRIGRSIARSGINMLISVGTFSRYTAREAVRSGMGRDVVWSCDREEEAVRILQQIVRSRDVILIKGSRAMRMENVVRAIIGRTPGSS